MFSLRLGWSISSQTRRATSLPGVHGRFLLSPPPRSPDDSLARQARLSRLCLQVLYKRLEVGILDRIGQVNRVAALGTRHRDRVPKIVRRPTRRRGGLRKLEETSSLDQSSELAGLSCRQIFRVYDQRLARR